MSDKTMNFLHNFNPEKSKRERRKITRKSYFIGKRPRPKIYDEKGLNILTGKDLCDCLKETCPGCHFPCPACSSNKCGHECRINRKFKYEGIEVEGNVHAVKNVNLTQT